MLRVGEDAFNVMGKVYGEIFGVVDEELKMWGEK